MLRITKYDNPEQTVIYEIALILSFMLKKRIVCFYDLYSHVESKIHGGEFLFQESINILFLLGKIDYFRENDSFILKK